MADMSPAPGEATGAGRRAGRCGADPQPGRDPAERAGRLPHARRARRGRSTSARPSRCASGCRPMPSRRACPARLQRMVALTRAMEFVTTASEVEALLLEANLIKRYRPAFNIVLRDDKSFPYIFLRTGHEFPLIGKHRGAKRAGTEYFGPFASAGAVNDTLNALLKAFPLRSCRDSIFNTRTRPCLQYQIKRCSAPCVGRIGTETYGRIVDEVREFLVRPVGRGPDPAAGARCWRPARRSTSSAPRCCATGSRRWRTSRPARGSTPSAVDDADVVAGCTMEGGQVCVQVFFYRGGRNYGNRAYYPAHTKDATTGEILAAFLAQFYAERAPRTAGAAGRAGAGAGAAGRGAGGPRRPQGRARGAAARRAAPAGRDRARPTPARRWPAGWPTPRARRRCSSSWPTGSTCPRRRAGSRSTTTATSRAATRSAPSSSPGPRASTSAATAPSTSRARELAAGDDYAMMREVLRRRFAPADPRGSGAGRARLAGSGGDRRRRRPAGRGPGGPGRARPGRPAAARGRQGTGAQRRAGAVLPRRAASRWRWTRATRSSTLCSGCATRRTGSRSRPIAGNGRATSAVRCSIRSPGSAPSASGRCSIISAPLAGVARGGCAGPGAGAGDRSGGGEGDP